MQRSRTASSDVKSFKVGNIFHFGCFAACRPLGLLVTDLVFPQFDVGVDVATCVSSFYCLESDEEESRGNDENQKDMRHSVAQAVTRRISQVKSTSFVLQKTEMKNRELMQGSQVMFL